MKITGPIRQHTMSKSNKEHKNQDPGEHKSGHRKSEEHKDSAHSGHNDHHVKMAADFHWRQREGGEDQKRKESDEPKHREARDEESTTATSS